MVFVVRRHEESRSPYKTFKFEICHTKKRIEIDPTLPPSQMVTGFPCEDGDQAINPKRDDHGRLEIFIFEEKDGVTYPKPGTNYAD